MISQDLVSAVNDHLSLGESPDEVKEFLLSEGWAESAIDSVFEDKLKSKEPSVWERMPFYQSFLRMDAKSAEFPGRVIFGISVGLIFLLAVSSFILFKITDPFNLNGVSRDAERDSMYTQLQSGLKRYYHDNNMYPASLGDLVPNYIKYVPLDPRSNKPYGYRAAGKNNFKLCIYFETKVQSADCVDKEFIEVR
jgi:hypothetical protein